jgi:hypothetical protein
MALIIRENAGKKFKMISELFMNKNFEYTFVLFVSDQSSDREHSHMTSDVFGSFLTYLTTLIRSISFWNGLLISK